MQTKNIDVCKTLMPPFPNIWTIGLTFDPDIWPTDTSINRGHLLNKDYLHTKFVASRAKRSWVIRCTRWSRPAWLWPTDLNINWGHLLMKDYLPTKFEGCWAKRSWVFSCTRWCRPAWPLTLTFVLLTWICIGVIYSWRNIYLPSLKVVGKVF